MSRWLVATLIGAALALPASAQERGKAGADSAKARFEVIEAEYDALARAYGEAIRNAATAEEKNAALRDNRPPSDVDYVRRCLEVAEADPANPGARDALLWIAFQALRRSEGLPGPWSAQIGRTFDLLVEHHADDPQVAGIALLYDRTTSPARERFLRELHAKAGDRAAKGTAALALGQYLLAKAHSAEGFRKREGRIAMWTEEYEHHMRTLDVPAVEAEAVRLIRRVIDDYGDVPYVRRNLLGLSERDLASKRTLADVAGEKLAEIRDKAAGKPRPEPVVEVTLGNVPELEVGKPAPPIEGKDLDGKPMKLSDYRGKVVVLVFWGSWCIPCLAEVPRERELAETMKGRPFALLGVDSDEDPMVARAAAEKTGMTWPSWYDGRRQDYRTIALLYQIHAYPSTFTLDAKGIIRDKRTGGPSAEVVEALVKEAEATTGGAAPASR
jgi:peroxiredoxin